MTLKIRPGVEGSFKQAINDAGWTEDEVLAAGHLRQGKVPRFLNSLWTRGRSDKLPREFVLAMTAKEILAFKATEGGGDANAGAYTRLKIREGIVARFPLDSVSISDLPEGELSKGATLTIDGESFPVARPNQWPDANTDEFIAVLASGVRA
jgi:hypothetical protein